jgi:glycosyltransferase involved in cell wall biosynthesis
VPDRLRIAQAAPPFERVPPGAYGGTERIVHGLVLELDRRGHEVTTFASGDSSVPGRHIETVPKALRPIGYTGDSLPYMQQTLHAVLAHAHEFDVIHSHLEWVSLLLARVSPVPVVSTFHGRLDLPWADALFGDPPPGLVAISQNQASTHPDIPWAGVVHNGLRLVDAPFGKSRTDALCFVWRVVPEKGLVEWRVIAKAAGRPLRIAA